MIWFAVRLMTEYVTVPIWFAVTFVFGSIMTLICALALFMRKEDHP